MNTVNDFRYFLLLMILETIDVIMNLLYLTAIFSYCLINENLM